MSDEYNFIPGDRVEFIAESGTGHPDAVRGTVYTVQTVGPPGRNGFIQLKELRGTIYNHRFKRLPRYSTAVIMAPLLLMRDELARNTVEWDMAKKAIEELGKIT